MSRDAADRSEVEQEVTSLKAQFDSSVAELKKVKTFKLQLLFLCSLHVCLPDCPCCPAEGGA